MGVADRLPPVVQFFLGAGGLLALGYAVVDSALLGGLRRLRRGYSAARPSVSVIVSARNEEETIENCLSSLVSQSYPADLYEIIIADDRSEDSTGAILDRWAARHPGRIRVIRMESCPPEISPKKRAMTRMIAEATGEIICATDADCIVPPRWIEALVREYEPGVEMVIGHSEFDPTVPSGWLRPVQDLEFLSHNIIAAGSIGAGIPLTCTGNNISYRKALFEEVGGFEGVEHILSGDDDLLLRKVSRKKREVIRYALNTESFVLTRPQQTGKGLLTQRSRWASTTTTYEFPVLHILIGIFLWYGWILTALAVGAIGIVLGAGKWGWILLLAGGVGWGWKTLWDKMVMQLGARVFRRTPMLDAFFPTALLHIPMIVLPVILGIRGNFHWKGRKRRG